MKEVFTTRLKALRTELNLSQQELCQRLDMNYDLYKNYETSNISTTPSYPVLLKLTNFFAVSTDCLLGISAERQTSNRLCYTINELKSKFTERIRTLRLSNNLSQTTVAESLGISLRSYQSYESLRESIMPTYAHIIQLAKYHGYSIDYLLGNSDDA